MKNFSYKKFVKAILGYLIRIMKLIIKANTYILKLILIYIFRFAKITVPRSIKTRVKEKLFIYPKLTTFLKFIHFRIRKIENQNKVSYLNYLLSLFARRIYLPLLQLMVSNATCRTIFLVQLKETPNLLVHFQQILPGEAVIASKAYLFNSSLTLENYEVSSSVQEIYKDLKIAIARYKISH